MKLIPLDDFELLKHPDKLLSIVGGAALGGFGVAFLVQLLVRGWAGKQLPRWALMTLRLGGGVGSGWLVALWMLGGGGWGLGGAGGWGFGSNDEQQFTSATVRDKETAATKDDDPIKQVKTLYVEVLGESVLDKLGQSRAEPVGCYRIETAADKLMTRREVVEYMKQLLKKKPPLEILSIVLYDDSPSLFVQRVVDLKDDAEGLGLKVATDRRKRNAPPQ